ncbi:MAG: glycosyl hydrolase [Kiritimatiellae bacterium]|nr:glycosyl hydrolase [Kiritimatiellia bacterium]
MRGRHRHLRNWRAPALLLVLLAGFTGADDLERAFRSPPPATAPWCYWYWISDNVSTAGLTRDLEAMARVGIRGALMGHIFLEDTARGDVRMLSEEWWAAVEHAVREGGRLGVEIGMFNCPGWSQSGGPWIAPTQAMRRVAWSELRARGPQPIERPLPPPHEHFQDIAVLAWPVTSDSSSPLCDPLATVTGSPSVTNAELTMDGRLDTAAIVLPGPSAAITVTTAVPAVVRSLQIHPAPMPFRCDLELHAWQSGLGWVPQARAAIARHHLRPIVGYWTTGPIAIACAPVTATSFRVVFSSLSATAGIAEVELRSGPVVERFVEKQLAKMCPDPVPPWSHYRWRPQPAAAETDGAVDTAQITNISDRLGPDGWLRWTPPPGEWRIVRFGLAPTMVSNHPAAPEARGLEVDKMNRAHARHHFRAYVGRLLERMRPRERRALRWIVADSYETGAQNWTDGFRDEFVRRYRYDPLHWLPTLLGEVVGTPDRSDRFLWDLRRLVADRIATEYVGALRDECARYGLRLWLENYGHWGFPSEFLLYGRESHEIGGEFWAQPGGTGEAELRAASSAAAVYGRRRVSAEAFTSILQFESTPASLKARGDWAVTHSINHWVLHVYNHQPWDERRPGVNAWFSTEFNRHTPWFEHLGPWIDYWRRIHALMQSGRRVADVALFIGDDAPVMTGPRAREMPAGFDYDFVNADALAAARIRAGRWTLRSGATYALLALPPWDAMRPETLARLRELVRDGGVLWGPRPVRSPSLAGWPKCDEQVRRLAEELWGPEPPPAAGSAPRARTVGRGRVIEGGTLAEVLTLLGVPPAIANAGPLLWTHRTTPGGEVFFVCHGGNDPVMVSPWFRAGLRLPEIWDPLRGTQQTAAVWRVENGGMRVALRLEPRGSRLIVFRHSLPHPALALNAVESDAHRGLTVNAPTGPDAPADFAPASTAGNFTLAGWARPTAATGLPSETATGIHLQVPRNEAVVPRHGDHLSPDNTSGTHAGVGVAVGTNGVVLWEHGASYFVPVLVHPAAITDLVHIAVVYRDRRPELWLDGRLVRRGLTGDKFPLPSISRPTPPPPEYRGDSRPWFAWPRPLESNEIARLIAARPIVNEPEGDLAPTVDALDSKGRARLRVFTPGEWRVKWQDGFCATTRVQLPPPLELSCGWRVALEGGTAAHGPVELERLMPLNEHTNPLLRYCAGRATWWITFDWTPLRADEVWLDLGRVESVAEVRLNGERLGVLWTPPYALEVTGRLRPGRNELEVRVAGTWRNRVIGHLRHPEGLPGASDDDERPWLARPPRPSELNADSPLQPFGLIGPVLLRPALRPILHRPE